MGFVTKIRPFGGSLKYCHVLINFTPANATLTINDIEQNDFYVKSGTKISWRISAPGYTAQAGEEVIKDDFILNIALPETQYQTLEIKPIPDDEKVYVSINGVDTRRATFLNGTTVPYHVSRFGYISRNKEILLIEDTILEVALERFKYPVTIEPTPTNADVYLNGIKISHEEFEYESIVEWVVSKEGYATQKGTFFVDSNQYLQVTLKEIQYYEFTINPSPVNSKVVINGKEKNTIRIEENGIVDWSVSKDGFETQTGVLTITKDTSLNVDLKIKQYVFSITPTPSNSKVYINDIEQKSIIADFESEIRWRVELHGYKTKTGVHNLIDNVVESVSLEKDNFTYTISPVPVDSIVYLNNQETNTITDEFETVVNWQVMRTGYMTRTGSHIITDNEVDTVELEKAEYEFSIKTNVPDCVVTLNGIVQDSILVKYGEVVNWSVTKTGYTPQSGSHTVTQKSSLDIVLSKALFDITISPTPSDSKVLINGIERKTISTEFETEVIYEVSHEGYETSSGTIFVTSDKTIEVALAKKQYTFSINTTPSNAVVTINGVQQTFIKVDYGTTVEWSVTATGYTAQSGSYTVLGDFQKDVLLVQAMYTFTIVPTPTTAIVTMNGVTQNSVTGLYNTNVNWSVAAQYYITQNGNEVLTDNINKTINLTANKKTINLSDCFCRAVNASAKGSTISWKLEVNTSTGGMSSTMSRTGGIVTGECRFEVRCVRSGYVNSKWSDSINITTDKRGILTYPGNGAIINIEAGETVTQVGLSYGGSLTTISWGTRFTHTYYCYKYI